MGLTPCEFLVNSRSRSCIAPGVVYATYCSVVKASGASHRNAVPHGTAPSADLPSGGVSRAGSAGSLFENCIASTKSKYSTQFKLLRVDGGCLGARSR
jgi:hypothetical protein